MADKGRHRGGGPVQTVDRALRILELLARHGSSRVTDVAGELGLHKSGAHRMLTTLAGHGLVEQDTGTDEYRLGFGLVGLASAVTAEIDVVRYAREPAQRLSQRTGETAVVTTLLHDTVVIVHQAASSASVLSVDWSGGRMPLHCTPGGKILLAHLAPVRRDELLSTHLEQFTQNTVVDPEALREDLLRVRERGYAYTLEELEIGLNGVAAPIYGLDEHAIAAIGVFGPAFRLSEDRIHGAGILTSEVAADVSRRLGASCTSAS